MLEESGRDDPPTFYANIVTMNLNVDELTIEFRRYLPAHGGLIESLAAGGLKPLPPPSLKEIAELEPIARVVLTYMAAKSLKEYLDQAFPPTVELRRQ